MDERGTAASMRLMSNANVVMGLNSSTAVMEGLIEESSLEHEVISACSEPWVSPAKQGRKTVGGG